MSLVEGTGGNGLVMPVAPMTGSGSGGNMGNGNWGNDGWWIILLFLFALGWGRGGYGEGGGNGGGTTVLPYMLNNGTNGDIQRGFDQQAVMGGINGIQSGIYGLSTQLCNCCADTQQSLCNGFAGVNATVNSGFANAETAANARQMANMNQAFTNQMAMNQGFNNIQSQFADCCCENRLASADLKYTIATENCADRAAIADGLRDVLVNQTANTQRILDQLCQDKIDEKNDQIAQLRQEVLYARGQASQDVQTARLLAGQTSEVDALYNRLSQCPVPCMPVYGMTPIFTCNNGNNGCGCGCNGGNF